MAAATERVGTYAHTNSLIRHLTATQKRVTDAQIQLTTKQKSQTYQGLASDSFRLVSMENQADRLSTFQASNKIAASRLDTMTTAISAVDKTIRDFKKALEAADITDYGENPPTAEDASRLTDLQNRAFEALKSMEYYLNVQHDGRYLFSGGKTGSAPVSLPYSSLSAFQAVYDGDTVTYPQSRAANLDNSQVTNQVMSFNSGTSSIGVTPTTVAGTSPANTLTIGASSISAATAGTFSSLTTGTVVEIDIAGVTQSLTVTSVSDNGATVNFKESVSAFAAGPVAGAWTVAAQPFLAAPTLSDESTGAALTVTGNSLDASAGTPFSSLAVGTRVRLDLGDVNSPHYVTVESVTNGGQTVTFKPGETLPAGAVADWSLASPAFQPGPVTVSGAGPNNATYTVTDISADGLSLTVRPAPATTAASVTNVSVAPQTYYQGDDLTYTHRLDEERTITMGINAKDPAFEKAMRAMAIIAQGTADQSDPGSLGRNIGRLQEALNLASDALNHSSNNTTEERSDLNDVAQLVGLNSVSIKATMTEQQNYESFLSTRITDIEGINTTEVAALLNAEATALETSYAAFARISSLSLTNYI